MVNLAAFIWVCWSHAQNIIPTLAMMLWQPITTTLTVELFQYEKDGIY